MDVEVVRLVVRVLNRPQLGGAGADHGVDSGHLHLLTVDLSAVELNVLRAATLARVTAAAGFQLLWKGPPAASEG